MRLFTSFASYSAAVLLVSVSASVDVTIDAAAAITSANNPDTNVTGSATTSQPHVSDINKTVNSKIDSSPNTHSVLAPACADGFLSDGGVTVDAGGVDVRSGGVRVQSGGIKVETGGLEVQDGGAVYQSTAGFALKVFGKTEITNTAENAPSLTVSTASKYFEDTLLELHTDTSMQAHEYDFLVAKHRSQSDNNTVFRVDGQGSLHTNGTFHTTGQGESHFEGSLHINGNMTVGHQKDLSGEFSPSLLKLRGKLDVSSVAQFEDGVVIKGGGLTLTSNEAVSNMFSIDSNHIDASAAGTLRFRRGKNINGSLYSAATNDKLGAVEFMAFDDDPTRGNFRPLASISATIRSPGKGHLILATSRHVGSTPEAALEVDSNQGVTFLTNATAMGVLSTRSRADSSSHASGALLSRGGLGVAKNVHIGGRVVIENAAAPRMLSPVNGEPQPSPPALEVEGDTVLAGKLETRQGLRVTGNLQTSNIVNNDLQSSITQHTLLVEGSSTVMGTAQFHGQLVIQDETSADTLGNGSIISAGGVSVAKNLRVGGAQYVHGASVIRDTATVYGQMRLECAEDATTSGEGALVVAGGASIAKEVWVGGPVALEDETNAEGPSTGALTVSGGLGVGLDIHAGGSVLVADELIVHGKIHAMGGVAYSPDGVSEGINYLSSGGATLHTGGALIVASPNIDDEAINDSVTSDNVQLNVKGNVDVTGDFHIAGKSVKIDGNDAVLEITGDSAQVIVTSSRDSVNTTSGSVIVGGGAAVQKNLTVGGQLWVQDNTASTSTSTGAIVTKGGVGIGGNVNVEGDMNLYGTLYGWSGLTGVFPDYVYDEDYPLMSISELASFVAENHHLPGVPSADEIDQQGKVDIIDLNRVLLEKVEEMSLYIIQLHESAQKREKIENEKRKVTERRLEALERLVLSQDVESLN